MRGLPFQLNKARRLIQIQGTNFHFVRPTLNPYNEPDGGGESFDIPGVYHETTGYITQSTGEGSSIRRKSSPRILSLWEEAQVLRVNDKLDLGGRSYRVNGVKNLSELNIIADISLEEVQS